MGQNPASKAADYRTYSMTILAAALQPDPTILCDCILLVLDPVVPADIELAGLEYVLRRLQHRLVCVALIAGGNHNQVKARFRQADTAVDSIP